MHAKEMLSNASSLKRRYEQSQCHRWLISSTLLVSRCLSVRGAAFMTACVMNKPHRLIVSLSLVSKSPPRDKLIITQGKQLSRTYTLRELTKQRLGGDSCLAPRLPTSPGISVPYHPLCNSHWMGRAKPTPLANSHRQ